MDRWKGRVALVTGASSGIGYNLAKTLAEKGMRVVGCARNIASIEKLGEELGVQGGVLKAVKCDVSREEDVKAMFHMIRQDPSLGRLDVCINSAGGALSSPLLTGDTAVWRELFDVNVLGLMMVAREAFQLMQENNIDDGHIILINSIWGKSVPSMTNSHGTAASKFAVSAIVQGLRHELREMKSNIRVTQILPGLVKTGVIKRLLKDEQAAQEFYSTHNHIQPSDISDSVLYVLGAPPHVEVNDVMVCPVGESLH